MFVKIFYVCIADIKVILDEALLKGHKLGVINIILGLHIYFDFVTRKSAKFYVK
jgi:hypothetical protein